MQIISYVYPGWHKSSFRPDVNEWSLLEKLQPYAPPNLFTSGPEGGHYDDSSFDVVSKQMRLASKHGVTDFAYFSYYDPPNGVLRKPYDQALLASPVEKVGVSQCWCAFLPIKEFPLRQNEMMRPPTPERAIGRAPYLSDQQRKVFFAECASDIRSNESYTRVDGRPVISFLNIDRFRWLYGVVGFIKLLQQCSDIVRDVTGVKPYLIGIMHDVTPEMCQLAKYLPFDAFSAYGLLADWDGEGFQAYEDRMAVSVQKWYYAARTLSTPFIPVVVAGWDASPRGERCTSLPLINSFPWRPIVTGASPGLFAHFINSALKFNQIHGKEANTLFVHAWNEWTEGSAIEPSQEYGALLLDVIANSVP